MAYLKLKNPTAFIIQKQVVRVEKLVGQKNKYKDIAFKSKIKLLERNRRDEVEKRYEDRTNEKERSVANKIRVPRLGFLDSVKNFLFSVLFGALTLKLIPHLPKLKGLVITGFKIGNFAVEFAGTILNAMVTFVDKVYGIIDFGKEQYKLLYGDKGIAAYESALGMTNKTLNLMLISGMLFSDLISLKAQTDLNQDALGKVGEEVSKQVTKRRGARAALQAAASRLGNVARVGAPIMLVGTAASLLGELTFQQRKFTQNLQNELQKKLDDATNDKNFITRGLKLLAYYTAIPGLRIYNFISNAVGSLLDIIGAPFRYLGELINFGIMSLSGDATGIRSQRENLAKFDARVREQVRQILNTFSLGLLAKEKGSWGNIYGDASAQRQMMNRMYGGGEVKVKKYAQGGTITRGGEVVGGAIGRSQVKKTVSRTFEIPISPLSPGQDSNGQVLYTNPLTGQQTKKTNIQTFFPNPESPNYVNPYRYLTKAYTIASSGAFLKPFLQMPIKLIMGDGPSEADYNSLAAAVNNLFNSILGSTFIPNSKRSLSDLTGPVDIFGWARSYIKEGMIGSSNYLMDELQRQFSLLSGMSSGEKSKPREGQTGQENPLTEIGGEAQFVIGDSIARGFAGLGATPGTDSDDSKVGRSAQKVLEILRAKGESLRGALIDLSTGIANSKDDWKSVEAQLSYLKSLGARVRVLGVGNQWSAKNGNVNQKLGEMVKRYGFYFYGGYDASGDTQLGLHADSGTYQKLKTKRDAEMAASASTQMSTEPTAIGSVKLTPLQRQALAILSKYESASAGGYNAVNQIGIAGGYGVLGYSGDFRKMKQHGGRSLTDMTIAEIMSLQRDIPGMSNAEWIRLGRLHAVGRYQFIGNTLPGVVARANISTNTKFSPEVQDILAVQYLKEAGIGAWKGPARYATAAERDIVQRSRKDPIPAALHGGYVDKTQMVLTHPDEYVIDSDSVKLFGIKFYDIINQTENVSQRKNASESLISILSKYTEDGFLETEDLYTYELPESQQVSLIPPQIIPIGSGFGGGFSDGDQDYSQDPTELR
jgi:hypothetical protein